MRSEERAGVIAAILLFTWGTLVTEPLHIFTNLIFSLLEKGAGKISITSDNKIGAVVIVVAAALISLGLMLLSRTEAVTYMPCAFVLITTAGYVIRCVSNRHYVISSTIAISLALAAIGIVYILRLQKVVLWIADIYILSVGCHILTGSFFIPLKGKFGILDKILYITSRQHGNLMRAFDGTLHLPAAVWGIFFSILLMLPTAYYAFSRKKG